MVSNATVDIDLDPSGYLQGRGKRGYLGVYVDTVWVIITKF